MLKTSSFAYEQISTTLNIFNLEYDKKILILFSPFTNNNNKKKKTGVRCGLLLSLGPLLSPLSLYGLVSHWAFGLPDFFGSNNSGNENCYLILVSKKHYHNFGYP
jgi:hypothetical protein